jgi:hypothetical protein
MEQSGDGEWYDGSDTINWVGGYSGAAFPSVPSSDCSLTQSGFLADFGDYNSGGLAAANWTENQVYDVSQAIIGTCALPEIYYSGNAPEWLALSQWAQSQGSPAMEFTGVMVEPGGTAECPPPNGATLLSASCAWTQLQAEIGQVPSIPGLTRIATSLQASGPQVAGVSPSYGPQAGGTTVTISGSGFLGAQTVYFGGQASAVTSGQVNSNGTSLTVVAPAEAPAFVDVVVVTALGSSPVVAADQYQFGAPACTAVTPSLQATSVAPGFNDVVSASAICPTGAAVKYSYFTRADDSGAWSLQAAWIGPSWTWQTSGLAQGTYQVLVWASDGPDTVPQVQSVADLTVAAQPACTSVSPSATPSSIVAGGVVAITATGICPDGSLPEYAYFTRLTTSSAWTLDAAWMGPNWSWSTAGLSPGSYQVLVWVSDGPYSTPQAQGVASVTISALSACSSVSVAAPTSVVQGEPAEILATATCPTGSSPLFSYFTRTSGSDSWTLQAAWIGSAWTLDTTVLSAGTYEVLAWASDGPYTVPQVQATATVAVDLLSACTAVGIGVPPTAASGLPVTVTAVGTCPAGASPRYSYFVRSSSAASWTLEAAWIGPSWSWQTADLTAGQYQVLVWVSDGPYTAPQQQTAADVTLYTQTP